MLASSSDFIKSSFLSRIVSWFELWTTHNFMHRILNLGVKRHIQFSLMSSLFPEMLKKIYEFSSILWWFCFLCFVQEMMPTMFAEHRKLRVSFFSNHWLEAGISNESKSLKLLGNCLQTTYCRIVCVLRLRLFWLFMLETFASFLSGARAQRLNNSLIDRYIDVSGQKC